MKRKEKKEVSSVIPDSFVFADSPRKGRLPLSPKKKKKKKTTRALGSLFIEIMFRLLQKKNQTAREHLFLLYMYGNVRCSLYYYFTYSLSFRFSSLILLDFFFFFFRNSSSNETTNFTRCSTSLEEFHFSSSSSFSFLFLLLPPLSLIERETRVSRKFSFLHSIKYEIISIHSFAIYPVVISLI